MPSLPAAVTTAMMTGAVLGVGILPRAGLGVAASIAAAAASLLVPPTLLRRISLLVAVGAASAAMGAATRDRVIAPPLVAWFDAHDGDHARAVVLDGVLVADASMSESGTRLLVDVSRVRLASEWHSVSGRVQAYVAGELAAARLHQWTAGRRIRAAASLRRPPVYVNVGGPTPYWQALRRRFCLLATIKSGAVVEVTPGGWPAETAAALRRRVRDVSSRFVAPVSASGAAIMRAILIGDRAGLSTEVERRLQAAGTYHVIAISGGNVALMALLAVFSLRAVVRRARIVSAGAIVAVVAYGWTVGGDPSVARAVTAAVVYFMASLGGWRPRPLVVLRTTAAGLVLTNPLIVLDVGAWLSFGATLGIVLCVARRLAAVRERAGGWWRVPVAWGAGLLAATMAAEAALLPVSVAVFGRVSLAGLPLNFAAIPAMTVVQLAGIATVLLSPIGGPVAEAAGWVTALAADVLTGSSALVDLWPWLSWRVAPPAWPWVVAYYAGAAACLMWFPFRRLSALGLAVVGLAAGVIVTAPLLERRGPLPGRLRVTVIDVGQGDAVLVQLPGGRSLLVDAGGVPGVFDTGSRVVTPTAWALGVRRLEWFALTHPDRDHIGGAAAVVGDMRPREIWEGVPVPPDPERARLRALSVRHGIPWRTLHAGARVEVGPASIEALHPPPPDWERQRSRNDDSLVLRVRLGRVEVWLTGDAGAEFERAWEGQRHDNPGAAIRVLKVGHHGSRTSTSAAFVERLRPQVALVSAGRGNLFGHPSADVIERLKSVGARIFRTDRDGGIVVETDGETARVWTSTGQTWSVHLSPW